MSKIADDQAEGAAPVPRGFMNWLRWAWREIRAFLDEVDREGWPMTRSPRPKQETTHGD